MKTLLYISHLYISILFCGLIFLFLVTPVFAVDPESRSAEAEASIPKYIPIVGIPGIDPGNLSTEGYLQALYYMSISIAALLTVYKILVGGIHWMFDGVITEKAQALKNIRGAIFGLLIVLSAVLILDTINVNLKVLNVLGNAPALKATEPDYSETPLDGRVYDPGIIVNDTEQYILDRLGEDCANAGYILLRYLTESTCQKISYGEKITEDNILGTLGMRALIKNCVPEEGEILAREAGNTPGSFAFICYLDPTKIDSKPGEILDTSLYPPDQKDVAVEKFKNSCNGTDEAYSDSHGSDDECLKTTVGSKLDMGTLVGLSIADKLNATLDFEANCTGTAVEELDDNDNVTFLVCK